MSSLKFLFVVVSTRTVRSVFFFNLFILGTFCAIFILSNHDFANNWHTIQSAFPDIKEAYRENGGGLFLDPCHLGSDSLQYYNGSFFETNFMNGAVGIKVSKSDTVIGWILDGNSVIACEKYKFGRAIMHHIFYSSNYNFITSLNSISISEDSFKSQVFDFFPDLSTPFTFNLENNKIFLFNSLNEVYGSLEFYTFTGNLTYMIAYQQPDSSIEYLTPGSYPFNVDSFYQTGVFNSDFDWSTAVISGTIPNLSDNTSIFSDNTNYPASNSLSQQVDGLITTSYNISSTAVSLSTLSSLQGGIYLKYALPLGLVLFSSDSSVYKDFKSHQKFYEKTLFTQIAGEFILLCIAAFGMMSSFATETNLVDHWKKKIFRVVPLYSILVPLFVFTSGCLPDLIWLNVCKDMNEFHGWFKDSWTAFPILIVLMNDFYVICHVTLKMVIFFKTSILPEDLVVCLLEWERYRGRLKPISRQQYWARFENENNNNFERFGFGWIQNDGENDSEVIEDDFYSLRHPFDNNNNNNNNNTNNNINNNNNSSINQLNDIQSIRFRSSIAHQHSFNDLSSPPTTTTDIIDSHPGSFVSLLEAILLSRDSDGNFIAHLDDQILIFSPSQSRLLTLLLELRGIHDPVRSQERAGKDKKNKLAPLRAVEIEQVDAYMVTSNFEDRSANSLTNTFFLESISNLNLHDIANDSPLPILSNGSDNRLSANNQCIHTQNSSNRVSQQFHCPSRNHFDLLSQVPDANPSQSNIIGDTTTNNNNYGTNTIRRNKSIALRNQQSHSLLSTRNAPPSTSVASTQVNCSSPSSQLIRNSLKSPPLLTRNTKATTPNHFTFPGNSNSHSLRLPTTTLKTSTELRLPQNDQLYGHYQQASSSHVIPPPSPVRWGRERSPESVSSLTSSNNSSKSSSPKNNPPTPPMCNHAMSSQTNKRSFVSFAYNANNLTDEEDGEESIVEGEIRILKTCDLHVTSPELDDEEAKRRIQLMVDKQDAWIEGDGFKLFMFEKIV